jgi:uncharacterized paraquat-inducible protein A
MEDNTYEEFSCNECDGSFEAESLCGMNITYCVFCGEQLDNLDWDLEPEDDEKIEE